MTKIKAVSLTVTILLMALIFFFSSQSSVESAEVSDGLIIKITELFLPHLTSYEKYAIVEKFSFFIRKAAHFTLYAALGISVIITIKAKIITLKTIGRAMAICVLYAISDEIHQNFVSGRSMRLSDVLLDSVGSLVGVCLFFMLNKCFNRKKRGGKD